DHALAGGALVGIAVVDALVTGILALGGRHHFVRAGIRLDQGRLAARSRGPRPVAEGARGSDERQAGDRRHHDNGAAPTLRHRVGILLLALVMSFLGLVAVAAFAVILTTRVVRSVVGRLGGGVVDGGVTLLGRVAVVIGVRIVCR